MAEVYNILLQSHIVLTKVAQTLKIDRFNITH